MAAAGELWLSWVGEGRSRKQHCSCHCDGTQCARMLCYVRTKPLMLASSLGAGRIPAAVCMFCSKGSLRVNVFNQKEELDIARREEGYELKTVCCPCGCLEGHRSCFCPMVRSFWLLCHRACVSSQGDIELESSNLTAASRETNGCRQFLTSLCSQGWVFSPAGRNCMSPLSHLLPAG